MVVGEEAEGGIKVEGVFMVGDRFRSLIFFFSEVSY